MPYIFTDVNDDAAIARLESFWAYFDFVVVPATGVVIVSKGYFAVFVSQGADAAVPRVINPLNLQYSLRQVGGGTLSVANAIPVKSRRVQYGNERGQLYLFELDPNAAPKSGWFNGGLWTPGFTVPKGVAGGGSLLAHQVSLAAPAGAAPAGAVTQAPARYAHAVLTDGDAVGVDSLAVVAPLLANSLFECVLKSDGLPFPTLTVTAPPRGNWSYFHPLPLPGTPSGYATIAAGGFRSNRLLSQMAKYHLNDPLALPTGRTMTPDQIADQLAETLDAASPLPRTLDSAANLHTNGVIQAGPTGPVEALYLKRLASPVPVL